MKEKIDPSYCHLLIKVTLHWTDCFIILIITVLRMATFFIHLDRPHYTAGDTVAGDVLMSVPASIGGCQGISLRLVAFECLKWVVPRRIPNLPSTPIQYGSSAIVPVSQPLHHADKIEVSECESEQKSDSGLRPRLVRTANNEFYEMEFHEERRELATATVRLFEGNKLAAGDYTFPFSFKSFQNWPGSFSYSSQQRKGQIRYQLTACIDPVSPHFDFEGSREVVISEAGAAEKGEFSCQVTSFMCIGKGSTTYSLAWREESYSPSSNAALVISIDNSHCSVDVKAITLSLVQSRRLEEGKTIEETIFTKQIAGVGAGEKRTDGKAIIESIDLSQVKGLLATSHGKLLTSQTRLTATLTFDALFFSCNPVSIPLKLYSLSPALERPLVFQKDFKPKKMPSSVLNLESAMKAHETGEKFGM